ncbi:MAG: uridine kinase [Deferribacteres bacterium]|nr:uridine kinase [candidate division KSB1 bacterium]MCB9511531.1 uridine kinase [Deferribacteres bacterium]
MKAKNKSILIGIAGGSGSGKTLVAKRIIEEISSEDVVLIEQDSYYRDLSHLSVAERAQSNFDHPDAIDGELMIQQIRDIIEGRPVEQPIYDFTTHTRTHETRHISGHHIVVLEGILILYSPRLRAMMDIKVFVDTDADIRLLRRINRDVAERGRTMESVLDQYQRSVRPMHLQFVEPSKRYADVIIPEGGHNMVAVDLLKTKVEDLLRKRGVT